MSSMDGPWRITFDTNPDICNLNCIMCEEHSPYRTTRRNEKRFMDFRIIEDVIESAVEHGLREIIPSTMGEPLLYRDFERIIDLVKKFDLKMNLTTNGTFPRRNVKEWGEMILPVASDIKISINGATKYTSEKIMSGISHEKLIENITNLIEIRDSIRKNNGKEPTITFQATYMERNLKELPAILKMAIDMDANRFKGHHLWVTWPELSIQSLRRNKDSINRWNSMVEILHDIAKNTHLSNGKKIKLDNVYKITNDDESSIVPDQWKCPFLGKEAWIAWDGTFNVCCSPDALRKKFGYFGNVKDDDFIELWKGKRYSEFIKRWGASDVCGKCNMRRPPDEHMDGNENDE